MQFDVYNLACDHSRVTVRLWSIYVTDTNSEIGVVSEGSISSTESRCTSTVNEEDNVSVIEKNTEANCK